MKELIAVLIRIAVALESIANGVKR